MWIIKFADFLWYAIFLLLKFTKMLQKISIGLFCGSINLSLTVCEAYKTYYCFLVTLYTDSLILLHFTSKLSTFPKISFQTRYLLEHVSEGKIYDQILTKTIRGGC